MNQPGRAPDGPDRPPGAGMKRQGPDARRVAMEMVRGVLDRRRPLEEIRDAHTVRLRLDERDRGFADAMATATLARLGTLDALIDQFLDRHPRGKAATLAMDAIRLGAAQLLLLDVPAHAAISASVDLMRGPGTEGLRGFVHAVLRRIDTQGREAFAALDQLGDLPDWVARRWTATYGEETARAIAGCLGTRPPLDLALTDPSDAATARWAETLGARILAPGRLRLDRHEVVPTLPGYDEGAWWVQDIAARLPVALLGDVRGAPVLDLCAAPGGKTAQLAVAGAAVTALDISRKRVRRVRENLERLRLSATLVEGDALDWAPTAPFGHVLLDAPCTATGTLRKHPDLLHTKTEADIAQLAALQEKLLGAAARLTAPGGVMVYATCSLEPEEGQDQARRFLAAHADVTADPIRAEEVPGFADAITAEGFLRTLPFQGPDGGADAFFVARFRKTRP